MKNIKFKTVMLIGVLIAVFTACKGSSSGTYTGSEKQPLNITIAQNDNIKFVKNASSRTIVADPFVADEHLKFYLWGTAQSGQTLNPKDVTVTSTDGKVGKVILDIECYNWSLTLAACSDADLPAANPTAEQVLEKAVLIGYGNVDMMFTNVIKFTLTPKGLSKTGDINLTLGLESGMVIPAGYIAKAYIYDITTGQKIKSAGNADTFMTLDNDELAAGTASFDANGEDLKPGTYSFQVEFTKANENRKYVWNDILIILPGKTVNDSITIPNLIGAKPAAPADFTVQFNKYKASNGTLTPEAEEAVYPGFYTAHFEWDGDAVNTEMNFALEIAEIADSVAVAAPITTASAFDAIFGDPADPTDGQVNAKYSFNYLNDVRANPRFYKGGSLFANSEYLDVYLELGKRYIARLYSENNAGYSTTAAYVEITPVEDGAVLPTINRYRVRYYTQGGTWNEGEVIGSGTESTADKIVYWSKSNQTYTVLNPVKGADGKGSAGNPYLYDGPADWIYWITDLTTGTKYPTTADVPDAYADYKNLNLYASYSREGDIEIYNDKTYDILQAWVSAFGINGTVAKNATNTVSKATIGTPTTIVSLTVPVATGDNPPTWKYNNVSFNISYSGHTYFFAEQDGAERGTANEFEIALSNLPTGYVYNCMLKAQYQMTTVSYPFTIDLTD